MKIVLIFHFVTILLSIIKKTSPNIFIDDAFSAIDQCIKFYLNESCPFIPT